MTVETADELEVLAAAARIAGRHVATALRRRDLASSVQCKAGGEPVTEIDRESDARLRHILSERLGYPLLSEESLPAGGTARDMLSAPRLLVVDPLDGTRELLSGTGDVAVLVGLLGSGEPQAGAVALPAEDLVLAGARGLGAFVQRGDGARKPMRVATGAALDASCRLVVSRAHPPPFLPQLIARAGLSAPHARGAVGLKLALVALGRADLYVHADRPIKIWDLCAPHAVVMAAGGVVTDLDGGALDYTSSLTVTSGLVSGTAAAHAACLKAIREIQRGGTSIEAASNR